MPDREMLSNVIGAPFDRYVLAQLYARAARNSTIERTTEDVLFLANKTAWVKLISSVNIALPEANPITGNNKQQQVAANKDLSKFYQRLGIEDLSNYPDGTSLAKRWMLAGGTSIVNGNGMTLRYGLGGEGSYGMGGTHELGYRPMPGLTSVTIDTAGRLGSLRIANINFKVWNMNQLNTVEALYFRLGYCMLLEWGHTQYYTNEGKFETQNAYGIDDPFKPGLRKEEIQQEIIERVIDTDANYDGMLGVVSNFSWAFNQDGGYDCNVKLIGLGSIMDSLRINQVYKLPNSLAEILIEAQTSIQNLLQEKERRIQELQAEKKRKEDEAAAKEKAAKEPPNPPKNLQELYEYASRIDDYKKTRQTFEEEYAYYPSTDPNPDTVSVVPDYYYLAESIKDPTQRSQYNSKTFGLFLQYGPNKEWKYLANSTLSSFYLRQSLIETFVSYYINNEVNNETETAINKQSRKTALTNLLDYNLSTYSVVSVGGSTGGAAVNTTTTQVKLTDPITTERSSTFRLNDNVGKVGDDDGKEFLFTITYRGLNPDYKPTREQVVKAFEDWYLGQQGLSTPALKVRSLETSDSGLDRSLKVTGAVQLSIPDVLYTGLNTFKTGTRQDTNVQFTISFNNTAFIAATINPSVDTPPTTPTPAQAANTGDAGGSANDATSDQTDQAYESALAAMLTYVKAVVQKEMANAPDKLVHERSILEDTRLFYRDGVFQDVIPPQRQTQASTPPKQFDLTAYARKGFNAALMSDSTAYSRIQDVDFNELCKAYSVRYPQGGSELSIENFQFPVYIKLGYLLAFLNNMCLIYDTTKTDGSAQQQPGPNKRPYLYIDFNPNTNFCLTAPQQLSVDPKTCLIPFEGDQPAYDSLYDPAVYANVEDKFDVATQNYVSGYLPTFKTGNPYQGKIMEILLNVDYLLAMARSFATSDPEHSVNLKRCVGCVWVGVYKSLGNFNVFRVAYVDESNVVQIRDDQFVPNESQATILDKIKYTSRVAISELKLPAIYKQADLSSLQYGQLPIFGAQSLARTFQFKTNMSTKLASMIAISAQAATGSINAKDPSSLSYLNANYEDRYKPRIVNPSNGSSQQTKAVDPKEKDNDVVAAQAFNTHIKNVYGQSNGKMQLDTGKIEPSKNYYIERSSTVKTDNSITSGAPFIPADLEITIDGISGIIMGQAFTIPEDRMPMSLRGEVDNKTKVGFIVGGLTHTIENNEWLTKIKGQMIRLRESTAYGSTEVIKKLQVPTIVATGGSTKGFDSNSIARATRYLLSKGYSSQAASAVVGSLLQESRLIPTIVNYDSKKAYNNLYQTYAAGIAQWVGPRRVNLLNFAKGKGLTIPDFDKAVAVRDNRTKRPDSVTVIRNAFSTMTLDIQLEFLVSEMQTYRGFAQFKTTTDLQYAIRWMYETYEGGDYSAGAAVGGRASYAANILQDITSGKI